MAKKKDTTEDRIVAVEEALSKTEQFIERNQRIITYVIGGLILATLLVFGFRKFVTLPKEKEAQKAIYAAEYYFEKDSLELALNGAGESIGFLGIIDDYSSTASGNLAKYYAGICYLNLEDYEAAIDYLKKLKPETVRVCTLIDKYERRQSRVKVDYACHTIDKGFLVGYGLDYDEAYRELPAIYHLKL